MIAYHSFSDSYSKIEKNTTAEDRSGTGGSLARDHEPLQKKVPEVTPALRLCLSFVASSSVSSVTNEGLQLLVDSGCSSHTIDPAMISIADYHPAAYHALLPPKTVYRVGSHKLLATGTATLTIGVENTASK